MKLENLGTIIEEQGFFLLKNVINKKYINNVKKDMIKVLGQYCHVDKNKSIDKILDQSFNLITKKSPQLRSNIYKCMANLQSIYNLSSLKIIKKIMNKIKIQTPRNLGSSIFAMEPNSKKYLILHHQDIRNDLASNQAINIWFPLTAGPNIGGVAIYPGSHRNGPIKHYIDKKHGKINLKKKLLKNLNKVEKIINFQIGDLLLFHPYLVHYSIINKGKKIRWTTAMCIDNPSNSPHLEKSFMPYVKTNFITNLTNEQLNRKYN